MSSYYHFNTHQQHGTPTNPAVSHSHHAGRNRRQPRLSVSHHSNRFRAARSIRDLAADGLAITVFRDKFEAVRSFDLEDDMEFIPNMLTESDLVSINSSSSERSSLASTSPESSPTQQPTTIAPTFSLNSTSPAFIPPTYQSQQTSLKLHQPAATRTRNAIPIINPTTGTIFSSPPPSVSPARMQSALRRW